MGQENASRASYVTAKTLGKIPKCLIDKHHEIRFPSCGLQLTAYSCNEGKVFRKVSHEKELNDIVAVRIKMGLRWWRDVLIPSQPKRYLDDR